MTTERLKELLEEKGYYCKALWNIKDVQSRFYCTDEEAREILKLALTERATTKHIFYAIEYYAKQNNLKQTI